MKKALVALCSIVLSLAPTVSVSALSDGDLEFYSQNNIYWYSSSEQTNSCFLSNGDGNVDYAGNRIFNNAQLSAIAENQPFYEKAQNETDVPWQMIAVIHVRESGLRRGGPDNGQGPYQDYAKNPPDGLKDGDGWKKGDYTDEEFQLATNWAANFIKGKAKDKAGLLMSDQNAVKYTFFAYNGLASVYVEQAKALGFTPEEAANGEGSPYVMNRADAQRDPDVNKTTWGQIKTDGGSIQYPANKDHGAYVMYASLAGVSACYGGTTDAAAALNFLVKYIQDTNTTYGRNFPLPTIAEFNAVQGTPGSLEPHPSSSNGCWGAWDCGECTALSGWFVTMMTEYSYAGGNGVQVVGNLMANADNIGKGLTSGTEPRPLSVFSEKGALGSQVGHTGVVLGTLEDGQIVTIENNIQHHNLSIRKRTVPSDMQFAYVGDKMKAQTD